MAGTTLNDSTLSIQIGSAWLGGGAPTYGAAVNVLGQVRGNESDSELGKVNVEGAGSLTEKVRFTKSKKTKVLRFVMPSSTGYILRGMGAADPQGLWIKITEKPHSALAVADVTEGVIERWRTVQAMDDASIEEVTITMNADSWQ